eukprot:NODE_25_length_35605_cov_0.353461.p4 type:complete len:673 gc:universal NODE_25_length_35605_cov_0.353461:22393-20375(-)
MNLHLNFTHSKVCHPYLMLFSTNTLFGLQKSTIKHVLVVPDIISDVEFHNGIIYIFGKAKVYCFKGNRLDSVLDQFVRENVTSQLLQVQKSKILINDWHDLKRSISFAIRYKQFVVVQFESEIVIFDQHLLPVKNFALRSYSAHEYMNLLIIHTDCGVFYYDDLFNQRVVFPLSSSPFLLHEDKIYQSQKDKTVVVNLLTKAAQYLHFNVHSIGNNTIASYKHTLDLYHFDFYKVVKTKSTNLNLPFRRNNNFRVFVSGCGEYVFLCADKLKRFHSTSGRLDAELELQLDHVVSHPIRSFVAGFSKSKLYVMDWDLKVFKSYSSHISDAYFLNKYLVTQGQSMITVYKIEDDFSLNTIRQFDSKLLCKSDYKIVGSCCNKFEIYFANSTTVFRINVITNGITSTNLNCGSDILQIQHWRNKFVIRHFDGIRIWKLPSSSWDIKLMYTPSNNIAVDNASDVERDDESLSSIDTLSTLSDDVIMTEVDSVEYEPLEYIRGLSWGSTLSVWKNVLLWQKIQQRNTEEKHVPFFLGDLQQAQEDEGDADIGQVIGEQPIKELPALINACEEANYRENVHKLIDKLLSNSAPMVDVALRCLDESLRLKMINIFIDAKGFTNKFEYLNAWINVLLQANGLNNCHISKISNASEFINQMSGLESKVHFAICSLDKIINE